MAQIEINCIGQTAIYTNTPEIFSGDVNIDTVKFTFDEAWNGYDIKTAVFYNNPKDTYPVMLDENNVAVIPDAVMANKCKLLIGVFGTNANGDVKTSKILTYNIGKGAITDDLEATTPPEFWEQLLTRQINFENEIDSKVDELDGIARVATQALAYNSYSDMITALNSMGSDELKRGQNIYIAIVGVPDLWVYGVEADNVEYTYVDDETFVEGLNKNITVQVGYFKLAQLETQKVDVGGITNAINTLQEEMADITTRVIILERGCTLPPRPVSSVTASLINYKDGLNEITASWTLGEVYDVQVDKINIYGYVGEEAPTDFSQFELDAEVSSTDTSVKNGVMNKPYNYILVAPVSTDGVVQKDLSQMCEVALTLDMPVKGTTFADMSWEDISYVSDNGYANKYFSVGDKKSITIDGVSYKVAIHGFNVDELADGSGKKAGMTIGLVNCLPTKYKMNNTDTNTVGWANCVIRTTLQSTIFYTLSEELRGVIKRVYKKTNLNGSLNTTTDNLFLFSEIEVNGSAKQTLSGEGKQYQYYKTNSNWNKKIGDSGSSVSGWWSRSPMSNDDSRYVYFMEYNNAWMSSWTSANDNLYVSFGFCI